jgi:hypothetical protein
MFHFLLPYIEQDNVYRSLSISGYAGGQFGQTFKVFTCPSDPSHNRGRCLTTYGGANNWGITSYAGNNYTFGNPASGNTIGENVIPSSYPDGLSSTVFFAEVYGTCGNSGDLGLLWGSLWADANNIWRPGYNLGSSKGGTSGYPAALMFQNRPNFMTSCDPTRPQSAHTNGLMVGLGDGSVRLVSMGISATTWARVNDPRDGQVPGADW